MPKKYVVLIVVVILGVASYFIPGVWKFLSAPAQMVEAVGLGIEVKQLDTMIEGFHKKYNRWPTEAEFKRLAAEHYKPNRTDSLRSHGLVDQWGEPYTYFRRNSGFVIISTGPDKKPKTKDDIILLRR